MHFSIPETEVCSGDNGSTYVVSVVLLPLSSTSPHTCDKTRFETPQVSVADDHLLLQFVCVALRSVNTDQTEQQSAATTCVGRDADKQMLLLFFKY